jgi:dTMP kinase
MASDHKPQGALISFEGVDFSGKSTQAELLRQHLDDSGCKVKLIKFPHRESTTGKLLDSYLRC